MNRKYRILFVLAFFAVVALVVLSRVDLRNGYPSKSDFESNRSSYVSVVEHISKMDIPKSESVLLTCDANWSIETIKEHAVGSGIRHRIAAKRTFDGRLVVTLITKEMGHAGSYGYVYCSSVLSSPDEIGPDTWGGSQTSIQIAPDMEWWVDETLPNNWWIVSNRLN